MKPHIATLIFCFVLIAGISVKAQQIAPPPVSPTIWPDAPWEKIANQLKKDLSLDKSQKQQVKEAYKNYYTEVNQYYNSETTTEDPKNPKSNEVNDDAPLHNPAISKLVVKRNAQVKKALSAEQYQKFLSLSKNYDQTPLATHGSVY